MQADHPPQALLFLVLGLALSLWATHALAHHDEPKAARVNAMREWLE